MSISLSSQKAWSPRGCQMRRWLRCRLLVQNGLFSLFYSFQNSNLVWLFVCSFRLWFIIIYDELMIWSLKKSCLQCPPTFEERESLTSNNGTNASVNAGFLIGLNLEASMPDTFQSPPVPLPYDMVLGGSASTYSESGRETVSSFETLITREDVEESDCKAQANSALTSPRKAQLPKSNVTQVLVTEEEDVCPICLEGTCLCY